MTYEAVFYVSQAEYPLEDAIQKIRERYEGEYTILTLETRETTDKMGTNVFIIAKKNKPPV